MVPRLGPQSNIEFGWRSPSSGLVVPGCVRPPVKMTCNYKSKLSETIKKINSEGLIIAVKSDETKLFSALDEVINQRIINFRYKLWKDCTKIP